MGLFYKETVSFIQNPPFKGQKSTICGSWQLFLIFENFVTKFDKGDNEYSSLNEIRICNNHYSTPPFLILKELEWNMGNDKFSPQVISAEKLNVPYGKWEQLLILMQDDGYIKGLVLEKSLESPLRHISEPIFPQITIKGLEYLAENSFMAKAKEALKMAGEIIP